MTTMTANPKIEVGQKLAQIQAWPHWDEIGLCAQKEYGLAPEQFQERLPEYQRFMALCAVYPGLGMTSGAIDQLWHSHILHTSHYDEFCAEIIGRKIDHLPCSSYPLYGVQFTDDGDGPKCVPNTCYGKIWGADVAEIAASILTASQNFRDAYQAAFGDIPPIWNRKIADGLAV